MFAPAPLTPDTLQFIRETSRIATVRDIAAELNWDVSRVRKTVRERMPGVELHGGDDDPIQRVRPHRRRNKDPIDQLLDLLEINNPTACDLIIALRSLQRGDELRFVSALELSGTLDITVSAVLGRINRSRDALAGSPFDLIGQRGSIGHGYRFIERGKAGE